MRANACLLQTKPVPKTLECLSNPDEDAPGIGPETKELRTTTVAYFRKYSETTKGASYRIDVTGTLTLNEGYHWGNPPSGCTTQPSDRVVACLYHSNAFKGTPTATVS